MATHIHINVPTRDAGWEESSHKRAPDGKFGSGGSSAGKKVSLTSVSHSTQVGKDRHLHVVKGYGENRKADAGHVIGAVHSHTKEDGSTAHSAHDNNGKHLKTYKDVGKAMGHLQAHWNSGEAPAAGPDHPLAKAARAQAASGEERAEHFRKTGEVKDHPGVHEDTREFAQHLEHPKKK